MLIFHSFLSQGQDNGPEWKLFNTGNSGLPGDIVFTVFIDDDNRVWVGTNQNGVGVFDGTSWINYTTANSGLKDNRIRVIKQDLDGVIWIGTDNGGLASFDGNNWVSFTTGNSPLPDNWVTDIVVDKYNKKWIATDNWMVTFDGITWEWYNQGISYYSIAGLAFEGDTVLWVCTAWGLNRYNFKNWTSWYSIPGMSAPNFWKVTVDVNGIKWIGSQDGLLRYDDNEFSLLNSSNSPMTHDYVMNITREGETKKWLATWGGIVVYDDVNWTIYNTENSLLQTNITRQVAIDKFGNKWIATDAGLLEYNENGILGTEETIDFPSVALMKVFPNPAHNNIYVVLPEKKQSSDYELIIFNSSGEEVRRNNITLEQNIIPEDISELVMGAYNVVILNNGILTASGKFVIVR